MKKSILFILVLMINSLVLFPQMLMTNNYNTNTVVTVYDQQTISVLRNDTITLDITVDASFQGYGGGTPIILCKRLGVNPTVYLDTFLVGDIDSKLKFTTNDTTQYRYMIIAAGNPYPIILFYVDPVNTVSLTTGYSANSTVGIDEKQVITSNVKIFPNPANNILTISFNEIKDKSTIEVYDIHGCLVTASIEFLDSNENSIQLNISQLKPGTYFVYAGYRRFKIIKI